MNVDLVAPALTVREVRVRAVMVPFATPLAAKVGVFAEWPLVLIDVHSAEGPIGRSYLAPDLLRATWRLHGALAAKPCS